MLEKADPNGYAFSCMAGTLHPFLLKNAGIFGKPVRATIG